MKAKLLRKIRKNWEIKQYFCKEKNKEIYRAVRNGKWVNYAWREVAPGAIQELVVRIAYFEAYNTNLYFGNVIDRDWFYGDSEFHDLRNSRKNNTIKMRNRAVANAKKVWHNK